MFETQRLILRKLHRNDIGDVFAMRKDPDVMRYIRGPETEREASEKWITMMTRRWDDEGIGFCGVIEKGSGGFIGWCGLWDLKETGEIEVGYAIAKSFWGNGFATEAARRSLEFGFDDLGLGKIVAVAYAENLASQNVMMKIGMKYIMTGRFYKRELVQYGITKEEFRKLPEDA